MESHYGEVNGSAKLAENKSLNVTVAEQKNRLFTGNLTIELENGTEIVEGFAGAIGLDNKTLYIAEFNEGYDIGSTSHFRESSPRSPISIPGAQGNPRF